MDRYKRLPMLDLLRGIAVLDMIVFHILFDLFYVFGLSPSWIDSAGVLWWQKLGAILFIIVSGFCFPLSQKPIRRGMFLFALGALVTVITGLYDPEYQIHFGILTFFGSSVIILYLLRSVLNRIDPVIAIITCVILFFLTEHLYEGYVAFLGVRICSVPSVAFGGYLFAYIGLYVEDFVSADYFPLIPWIFIYGCGYFLFRLTERQGKLHLLRYGKCRILEWIGRHSLLIYLLHQPIFIALFSIVL